MIDATQAAIQALAQILRGDGHAPVAPAFIPPGTDSLTPTELGANVVEGWSNQRDTLVYPTIEIDAGVAGERVGRTATVIDISYYGAGFELFTIHLGSIEIPIQLRVTAESKAQRAALDRSIDVMLMGDFYNESPMVVSDPVADYYSQTFQFRQAGSTRYFDSTSQAGRDEFTSLREVETDGSVVIQLAERSLEDLTVGLKVIEAGKDFDLVVAEDVTIF